MSIKHVIIHVVKRDKDGEKLEKQLRDTENSTAGLTEKLTEDLITLFSSTSLNIGEFGVDGDNTAIPVFEQKLDKYYDQAFTCSDFVQMTQDLTNRYETVLLSNSLSSVKGGYLVFYHYEYRNEDWLAIAVLQRSEGVDIDTEKLDVISTQILELEKLHLGASVNLTKWKQGLSHRYIKFKTGRSSVIRDYFEKFIGCQRDKLAAVKETKNLRKAIVEYATQELKLTTDQAQQKVATALSFIKEQTKEKNNILLTEIAKAVFPTASDDFLATAQLEHDLSEELAIDPTELRHYEKISGKGNGVTITFERDKLDKTVIYKDGILSFHEIPDSLKDEILEEYEIRAKADTK
ncbi:nucleoid-associated protein [Colwellia sp. 6_MG-2023]|uniref:nucleoid-associated protein n=1 Tax=Colwellia sp. 6_MG-2023 TaxID=3062676 RepID=UPI0026E1E84A|nr:nucleoid-associated protein [Colwellia sp. 6_MG-2023]MDO6488252.1 nucleoid-associated protein [Colwellia sp. 6_MG-2023]